MDSSVSLITFKIGEELYGIDIIDVKEIIDVRTIIPIPNSPDFVDGIITLRGSIIPIIDLAKRFRFELTKVDTDEYMSGIMIINVYDLIVGIILDKIDKIIKMPISMLQYTQQVNSGVGSEYIKGIIRYDNSILIVLDTKRLFNKNELQQLSGDI
jgi:purine-binding chemotaxis protein CheW